MAKRFIDTGIFDDTWFMDLSKDAKIAWLYLITKCDHAGIIEINEKLMILQTGIKSWGTVRQELNSRLINLRDNYFFIPKFIQFQYPNFPKSNVNQQTGAIKRLCEFGLFCDGQVIDFQALNSSPTLDQDLAKSYGNGNEYNNVSIKDKNSIGSNSLFPEEPKVEPIKKEPTWRDDFNIYLFDCKTAFASAWDDTAFIEKQEYIHADLDIRKTMVNAEQYWCTEEAWEKKASDKKIKRINWRLTIITSINNSMNHVRKLK